jgi:hypothetical protein
VSPSDREDTVAPQSGGRMTGRGSMTLQEAIRALGEGGR